MCVCISICVCVLIKYMNQKGNSQFLRVIPIKSVTFYLVLERLEENIAKYYQLLILCYAEIIICYIALFIYVHFKNFSEK